MDITLKFLTSVDEPVLTRVVSGTFDNPIDPALTREFLKDPRHHIVVALDGDLVVGFVSAVDYVHPDKARELWINEVAVAPSYQRRGIAKRLMQSMIEEGKRLGCTEAWLGTERSNVAAVALYKSIGGDEPLNDAIYYTFKL